MKGLKIKEEWLDLILKGDKTLEIRSSDCHIRGKIGLVKCRTSMLFGEANLIGTISLTKELFYENKNKHLVNISWEELTETYKTPHAWILEDVKEYKEPKKIKNPKGAVIWLNIEFI